MGNAGSCSNCREQGPCADLCSPRDHGQIEEREQKTRVRLKFPRVTEMGTKEDRYLPKDQGAHGRFQAIDPSDYFGRRPGTGGARARGVEGGKDFDLRGVMREVGVEENIETRIGYELSDFSEPEYDIGAGDSNPRGDPQVISKEERVRRRALRAIFRPAYERGMELSSHMAGGVPCNLLAEILKSDVKTHAKIKSFFGRHDLDFSSKLHAAFSAMDREGRRRLDLDGVVCYFCSTLNSTV